MEHYLENHYYYFKVDKANQWKELNKDHVAKYLKEQRSQRERLRGLMRRQ